MAQAEYKLKIDTSKIGQGIEDIANVLEPYNLKKEDQEKIGMILKRLMVFEDKNKPNADFINSYPEVKQYG